MNSFRALTIDEIVRLKAQACVAEDWTKIQVAEGFRTEAIYDVRFSGEIRLGAFDEDIIEHDGFVAYSGIRHATLHNVTVGDGCLIENIGSYISNYEIGNQCFIRNVGSMMTTGHSTFGNGVTVAAVDESGGCAFPICEGLSAPVAYAMADPQADDKQAEALRKFVQAEAARHSKAYGTVDRGAYICDTRQIVNVNIGSGCVVNGASKLANGTLLNEGDKACTVGADVIAQDFILSGGSVLDNGVILTRCFVGQGSHLSNRFTATDCYIASNCHFENGEACSIFAGPYTVSHHKNTLLIAGAFSFMNAGSGTNQSNHLYKAGPIHHGLLRRGCKTASDSYLMWPAQVGAFSLVMGRIKGHPDTTAFPFSYLLEQNGKEYLVPGVNLLKVGTWRDVLKWPERDKRVKGHERDLIRFDLLNPRLILQMLDGLDLLREWNAIEYIPDEVKYNSLYVRKTAIKKGIELYRMALRFFVAQSFARYLKRCTFADEEEFAHFLPPQTHLGDSAWVEWMGYVMPQSALKPILDALEDGQIEDLNELQLHLQEVDEHYDDYLWSFVYPHLEDMNFHLETREDFVKLMEDWKEDLDKIQSALYDDLGEDLDLADADVAPDEHPVMETLGKMLREFETEADDVINCLGDIQ